MDRRGREGAREEGGCVAAANGLDNVRFTRSVPLKMCELTWYQVFAVLHGQNQVSRILRCEVARETKY